MLPVTFQGTKSCCHCSQKVRDCFPLLLAHSWGTHSWFFSVAHGSRYLYLLLPKGFTNSGVQLLEGQEGTIPLLGSDK